MGNFRSDSRDREFSSNRSGRRSERPSRGFGGGRSGGRSSGGFRDRDSGSFERKRLEMHKVTCANCHKQCEVPFRPTGDKPVFCSDCFRKEGSSSFDSSSPNLRGNSSSSGISQEQYKELNIKLDKILRVLEMLEIEEEEEDEEDNEDDSEDEEIEEEIPRAKSNRAKK